jgi:alpha-tubulin suppressor-like RCC1 family protein
MASLLDLFGLKSRKPRSDDIFLDAVKQSPDIWEEIFSDTLKCIVICPSSSALGEEHITREFIMAHILLPERNLGDFVNLFGQKLSLVGNEFQCKSGFPERRKVKIVNMDNLSDGKGSTASVYRVNRPLIGGILSPEEPEEVTFSLMHKFVAMLRAYPEAESVFNIIDKYTQEVNFVGQQSLDSYSKIKPSLKSSLESQWLKCSERLCQPGSISGIGSDPTTSKHIVGQVVESYMMTAIGSSVYQWICRQLVIESGHLLSCVAIMQSYTQTDLGIRPELQCSQNEAVRMLRTLADALTPLDKLVVLKKTVSLIREGVDRNVNSKFVQHDIELATDDIVCFVIWVIIKCSRYYENIYYDIHYAADYHFVPSSKTDLGFCLNHFQVALSWIIGHAMVDSLNSDAKSDVSNDGLFEIGTGILKRKEDGELPHGIVTSAAIAVEQFIITERSNFSIVDVGDVCRPLPSASDHLTESYTDSWSLDSSPMSSQYNRKAMNPTFHRAELTPQPLESIASKQGREICFIGNSHSSDIYPEESESRVKVYSEESGKECAIMACCGGNGYYFAIDTSCRMYSWGFPSCGRLGHNLSYEIDSFTPIRHPVQISSIGNDVRIGSIACGSQHTIAVSESGEVFAWGDNRCAQLGISSGSNDRAISGAVSNTMTAIMASGPVLVEALKHERIIAVTCGAYHSLCLTANGALYSWGRAANGRLGQFQDRNIPEHSVSRPSVVRGPWMSLALSAPSKASSHPSNKSSRLSNSYQSTTNIHDSISSSNIVPQDADQQQSSQTKVVPVVSISAGHSHSLAVTNQGEVYTWGCGKYGRLGHGSHVDEYKPKIVAAFNRPGIDIIAASCGSGHTLFLTKEGFLFGCGWNRYLQVAAEEISTCRSSYSMDGDCILVPQPIAVTSADPTDQSKGRFKLVEQIACGEHHSAVITKDKNVFVWGFTGSSAKADAKQPFHDVTSDLKSAPYQVCKSIIDDEPYVANPSMIGYRLRAQDG